MKRIYFFTASLILSVILISCQFDVDKSQKKLLNDIGQINDSDKLEINNKIIETKESTGLTIKVIFFEKSNSTSIEKRTIAYLDRNSKLVQENTLFISVCLENREVSFKSFSEDINSIEEQRMQDFFTKIKRFSKDKEIIESLPYIIGEIKNLL